MTQYELENYEPSGDIITVGKVQSFKKIINDITSRKCPEHGKEIIVHDINIESYAFRMEFCCDQFRLAYKAERNWD